MAKQKQPSKRAVKTAAKKPAARAATKVVSKSSARKPTKLTAKASAAAVAKNAAKPAIRRKQQVAVSHYHEEDFATGLRSYAKYRDLGVAAATNGMAQAHVIRLIGPCDPAEVSKLHYHDAEFQLVYVLNGWVKAYMEGQGEMTMRQGSCWTQPPRIKHLIRDYSDNCELLEVILPAQFKTVELKG
jgi:mannose-6-phosphate isomerase-like protein (cupin superfamily)